MLKINVTSLNNVSAYMKDEIEVGDLIERLTGEYKPTALMKIGESFHAVLESPYSYYDKAKSLYVCGGYEFTVSDVLHASKVIPQEAIYELSVDKIYSVNGHDILVTARVDAIYGRYIYENKTTFSTFSFDRYYDSMQWRYYLDMMDGERMYYNIFCMKEPLEDSRLVTLRSIERFYFKPYPSLADDIKSNLSDFITVIEDIGIKDRFECM